MRMKKRIFTAATALVFFAVLLSFSACSGEFTDPEYEVFLLGGGFDDKDGDDYSKDSSKSKSNKPAELSSSATAAEALAKLDEIIAYSDTPDDVKKAVQIMKAGWSTTYSPYWTTVGGTTIDAINGIIKALA
jgi:hypothetical protein